MIPVDPEMTAWSRSRGHPGVWERGQEEHYRMRVVLGPGAGIYWQLSVCRPQHVLALHWITVFSLWVHIPVAVLRPYKTSLALSTWQLSSRLPGSADAWHRWALCFRGNSPLNELGESSWIHKKLSNDNVVTEILDELPNEWYRLRAVSQEKKGSPWTQESWESFNEDKWPGLGGITRGLKLISMEHFQSTLFIDTLYTIRYTHIYVEISLDEHKCLGVTTHIKI